MHIFRRYARSPRGRWGNIRISGKYHAHIGLVAAQYECELLGLLSTYLRRNNGDSPKGRVIIMDNASFDLYRITKNYLQQLIFLPPYLPPHNPIEHTWVILKRKIESKVLRYGSVAETLDVILQEK